jgi:hypothetical protein
VAYVNQLKAFVPLPGTHENRMARRLEGEP